MQWENSPSNFDRWVGNNPRLLSNPLEYGDGNAYILFETLYNNQGNNVNEDIMTNLILTYNNNNNVNFRNNADLLCNMVVNMDEDDGITNSFSNYILQHQNLEQIISRINSTANNIRDISQTVSSLTQEKQSDDDSFINIGLDFNEHEEHITFEMIVYAVLKKHNTAINFETEILNPLLDMVNDIRKDNKLESIQNILTYKELKEKCTNGRGIDDFVRKFKEIIRNKIKLQTTCRDNQFLGKKRDRDPDDKDPDGGLSGRNKKLLNRLMPFYKLDTVFEHNPKGK